MICRLGEINWRKISTITSSVTPLFILQMTVLHLAAEFKCSAEIFNILIEAGADVHAVNCSQSSPLHYASKRNPAVVPVLLEAGAKVNVLDVVQCSPLYWAALFDHKESVIALMKASADLHLGENPLKDPSVSKKMKTLIKNLFK